MIEILEFNKKSKLINTKKNQKREMDGRTNALYEGKEMVFNAFKDGIFPLSTSQGIGLKILAPKQMLQR